MHVSPNQKRCFSYVSTALSKAIIWNHTCESYLEALFLTHISSLLKGNFQNNTYKSYPEALFLAHISSLLEGDFLKLCISPFKGDLAKGIH